MKNLQVNLKHFTKNISTRLETLQGVDYIVAPVIMIREGVLPGSAGPILYLSSEIKASVAFWDGVPITVNHPTDSNGNNTSARTPSIIEKFGVGQIYNTTFDETTNSLKADAYINKKVLEEKFPEVYAAILDDNTNMDVSTGVFFDDKGEPGDFNGISYNTIAYSYHGDHLALLPNDTGACSWADGCGLRANKASTPKKEKKPCFNELSYQAISDVLRRYVDSLDNNEYIYYVDAIYDSYFTFERTERDQGIQRTLWKQEYTKINDIITPIREPLKVREQRIYTVVKDDDYKVVDEEDHPSTTFTITNKKDESDMADDKTPCCPEKVESLIAEQTNSFTEADKETLLSLNAKQLESVIAMNENAIALNSTPENKGPEKLQTIKEFIDEAPDHIKMKINSLLEKEENEKMEIVDNILKDENCTFSKEELVAFEVNVLQKMAGLAKKEVVENKETTQPKEEGFADMTANAGTQTKEDLPGKQDTLAPEDTLQMPKINWATA